jgi:hypothetical protein
MEASCTRYTPFPVRLHFPCHGLSVRYKRGRFVFIPCLLVLQVARLTPALKRPSGGCVFFLHRQPVSPSLINETLPWYNLHESDEGDALCTDCEIKLEFVLKIGDFSHKTCPVLNDLINAITTVNAPEVPGEGGS